MSSRIVDEEKGEAGLKEYAVQGDSEPSTPSTPTAPTLINSPTSTNKFVYTDSTLSKDGLSATATYHEPGVWSRRVGSISAFLGIRWKPRLTDEEAAKKEQDRKNAEEAEQKVRESIVLKIDDQPEGYPRMAAFMDSDENFMMYRRFGCLQTRLILERQDELRSLEDQLEQMEYLETMTSPDSLKNRLNISKEKAKLFRKIENKWNSYCRLMSNASSMVAMNKPTDSEQYSVAKWLWKNVRPVRAPEMRFVKCKEDLVTLRPGREHAWLDASVEKLLQKTKWRPLQEMFRSKDTRAKSDGEDGTFLYTRGRIENFVVSVITLMILALLVVPIWALYYLTDRAKDTSQNSFECIGVLLVSTLAFSACLSLFTRARRHEILGASAAYCAVLVVFIGNLGQHT